ncbi:hypothetical protein LIER_08787 [Lithospermum erythrorhizon]|uniref:Uncharacterized protein n=1 Tax=Lithospermum erythrorhizon TaxID=34254 RepID=A0AAV3PEK8_LITER
MGCSSSKLDDEEAVQLCKDRKKFIKQAVEQRARFVSGHFAYIQSMKRVSAALREYIEGETRHEFSLDSIVTPPFTPVKKSGSGFISISPKSFLVTPFRVESKSSVRVNYLRSGGTPSVSVEERPPRPPETVRIQAYSPVHDYGVESSSTFNVNYVRSGGNPSVSVEERPPWPRESVRIDDYSPVYHYGMDNFFTTQTPPGNHTFQQYSPDNRPYIPPHSPQTSQWDLWNPFSSLDYYGYTTRSSLEHTSNLDDEASRLRQVREEEGIPELEEETELEDNSLNEDRKEHRCKVDINQNRDEVVVEDDDDGDNDDDNNETKDDIEVERQCQGFVTPSNQNLEVSKAKNTRHLNTKETAVADGESKEDETPGFTVYVNQKPTSMEEVMRDLDTQFKIACNSACEVSAILETCRAQYVSPSNELSAMKMLNPVALIRSAASQSSSSRFLVNPSSQTGERTESISNLSEDVFSFSGSHQSTLDRLYAWEKKLYQEVKEGERVRIAYEKKCAQLRNQDVNGADPSVEKTQAAIRDLYTRIKVSVHSVEAISKRIETLRDEEMQPQLLELVHGLARMWKVMAECHQVQINEAKILLAGLPSKLSATKRYTLSPSEPYRLARSAANLETELRNWRTCFELWIVSQRSYMQALAGWLLRCVRLDADTSTLPFSPRRSTGTLPMFNICIQWSRFLDSIRESRVLEGLDFCAAGVGSLYAKQLREDSRHSSGGSKRFESEPPMGNMEVVEVGEFEEEVMTAEKMAEIAIRVLCAGMSVAVSSLTEFAISSAEGYADLLKELENIKKPHKINSIGI